jgi:superfamily II DNA or RNA helicase
MFRDRVVMFFKALQDGSRWITIRPPGHDKGQPVLIQPQPDGSAKVIGGAGGSLNHLRLTGVKPQSGYKQAISERATARTAIRKEQRARDKKLGLQDSKAKAHEKITEQKRAATRDFISGAAKALGWTPDEYAFDESSTTGKTEAVVSRLREAHDRNVVQRAMAAINVNRERLLADADARAEVGLGEIPLTTKDANVLSVQDLDPIKTQSLGLGFSTKYGERAEAAGADAAEIAEEAEEVKKPLSDAQKKAIDSNAEVSKAVRENLELMREPDQGGKMAPKLVEAKKAVELLKLEKKLKMAQRKASAARKEINEAVTEPKAYVLDVDDASVDAGVADAVASDLRTIQTRSFLAEVGKTSKDPSAALGRHIGVGAYNSVNALALAAGGAALVDRSVVDVLGIAGAADVLARRLRKDLTPEEFATTAAGMEDFHLHHYMEASKDALARARELQDHAKELELGVAENGDDLSAMQEVNARRAEALAESQKVLGTALGEMEANAALVYAMKGGEPVKDFQVSLGRISIEGAISQVRAIGLQRGDYNIETVAGNRVLSVTAAGMDRLAAPVNRDDLEQVRRNLDIIGGKSDEDGWMPLGVVDRPDLDLHIKPGVAPRMAEPFAPSGDLASAVTDYIGGRTADGDRPADIVSDLQSADFIRQVGADRVDEYLDTLQRLAPLTGPDGKMRTADALQDEFEKMADSFVKDRYGEAMTPLHRQKFPVDDVSAEALHRGLAAEPAGVAAYKPIGEMTPQDQGALREFFAANVAKESPEAAGIRHDLEAAESAEPERDVQDMFGDTVTNPEWQSWRHRRDDLRAKVNSATINWPKYVESMHGPEKAYSAVQDLVRSKVSKGFADTYNTLRPDAPLKLGRSVIRENLNHLDSVDPVARDARMEKERALTDSLRERAAGRYASGGVRDRLDAARAAEAGMDAAQMGFFADEAPADKALEGDERYSVGHEAERQIGAMMPQIGQNFKPGEPVKLFRPSMSGGNNWARQRAIKMIEANKRAVLSFGTGAGKTLITLGGFTHLQQQGKAKRGLFLVPSIAQGQFGAESLRFLKPGTFKWSAQPGASREQRIAAYKDGSNNFGVFTHQAFRDDMLHLAAQHAGVPEEEMSTKVAAMSGPERKEWMRGVMEKEGIDFDYVSVDEGHNTLNRKGKENSAMANVIDSVSDNANYFVTASADPVKNDVSEAFSLLQKMDPARYTDESAFMRKYGVDGVAAKDGLRREMARFQYPSKIDPDITASRIERKVSLSGETKGALEKLDQASSRARLARMSGKVDLEAVKELSPSSFDGVPESEHEAIAKNLQDNVGILKDTATRRILNGGAKIDEVSKVVAEHKGKPGVVFAHSLENVEAIGAKLRAEGHRVVTITGKDSAKAKSAKKRAFNPDAGEATADILVASDAAATGLNAQRGQYVVNVDTPQTAMTHAQRNGRVNRIGQKNNVDLIDLVADHPAEVKNRKRLETKYALRDALTTPMESLDDTGLAFFLRQRQIDSEHGGIM